MMNTHAEINDLLPLYAAGTLNETIRRSVENHLAGCPECQIDLLLWQDVGQEVSAQAQAVSAAPGLPGRALAKMPRAVLRRAGLLLRTQMRLIQPEIWLTSAIVILLGLIVSVTFLDSIVLRVVAPLTAAACLAVVYGPEFDPGIELALATPTSPWQVLLARLALVFSYNFSLTLLTSFILAAAVPQTVLAALILGWLGPMAFLSALALLLSMLMRSSLAISISYGLWLAQLISSGLVSGKLALAYPAFGGFLRGYVALWQNPPALLGLAALLVGAALWLASRQKRMPSQGF